MSSLPSTAASLPATAATPTTGNPQENDGVGPLVSFFWTVVNMVLTLGGILPANAADAAPPVSTNNAGSAVSTNATPAGTTAGAPAVSSFVSFLSCFGLGTAGQAPPPPATALTVPLLPVVTPSSASLGQTTSSAPGPGLLSKGCSWISSIAPDSEGWKDFISTARESIDWIISTLFPFIPAKAFALSLAYSLVLGFRTTTEPPSSSRIHLAVSDSFLFPTNFILAVVIYSALNATAKMFVNGKLRFLVEGASLGFGVAALCFLVDSIHQFQITFEFACAGGVVLILLSVLKIWDRLIAP